MLWRRKEKKEVKYPLAATVPKILAPWTTSVRWTRSSKRQQWPRTAQWRLILGSQGVHSKKDMPAQKYANSIALSRQIWELKDKNENYDIVWSITDRAPTFNPITRACRLCLKEKYYIMFYPHLASLNERTEFFSTCRHRKQLLFENTWG